VLCFNLERIGQYSWPAAGENHTRDGESSVEEGDILPACLADAASCYQPSTFIYVLTYNPKPSFYTDAALPAHTCSYGYMFVVLHSIANSGILS